MLEFLYAVWSWIDFPVTVVMLLAVFYLIYGLTLGVVAAYVWIAEIFEKCFR